MKCILPNSEIEISYGDQLTFTNNCIEGTGFQPDIWIGGQDALERTLTKYMSKMTFPALKKSAFFPYNRSIKRKVRHTNVRG